MFKLLKTILNVGDTTVKYPFKPYDVCQDFRGKPEYNAEQCIACAACTMACPANALTMNTDAASGERVWALFLGRCIFCGRCEEVCPTRQYDCRKSSSWQYSTSRICFKRRSFRSPPAASATSRSHRKSLSIMPSRSWFRPV